MQAMKEMKRIRLRDGAIRWNLLRDSADPERYLEIFVTESWGEHLRQHERVTAEDRKAEGAPKLFMSVCGHRGLLISSPKNYRNEFTKDRLVQFN